MTDRELLELAAKAAGMDYLHWTPGAAPFIPILHRVSGRAVWNPLTDDGDALRLAVKLRIELLFRCGEVFAIYENGNKRSATCEWLEAGGPVESATRRAIVRAAAGIGKAVK